MPPTPPRYLGVFGDIHTEDLRLSAGLRLLRDLGAETFLSVGDIVDGPGDPNRCCALLQQAGALCVAGNHERWLLQDKLRTLPDATPRHTLTPESLSFLHALPPTREIDTQAGPLLLCHGLGPDDMATLRADDSAYALAQNTALHALCADLSLRGVGLVLSGHSHRPMIRRIESLTFINAGTLARQHEPSCLWLDTQTRQARWYSLQHHARPVLARTLSW